MISFIHSLFALLFRGAFLLLMLLIFLLICFNFLFFKIFLPAFLPCLFLKNLACSLVGVSLVGVLGGGYLHALELVPCWLVCPCVPCGFSWLVWLPACLGACALARVLVRALLVRVVGSDYLHALNLVSLVRALVVRVLVGSGYLHALNLVSLVRALVVGWWLEVVTCMPWSLCLGACALVVRAWWWLPAYLGACALLVGVSLCALWFFLVGVVTCMPWS